MKVWACVQGRAFADKVWACVQGRVFVVRYKEEGEVAYVLLISLVVVLRDEHCGEPCLEKGGRRQ